MPNLPPRQISQWEIPMFATLTLTQAFVGAPNMNLRRNAPRPLSKIINDTGLGGDGRAEDKMPNHVLGACILTH